MFAQKFEVPPILVRFENGKWLIVDGHLRTKGGRHVSDAKSYGLHLFRVKSMTTLLSIAALEAAIERLEGVAVKNPSDTGR
ncbi:hypothetical protein NK8_35750 [Caballeronia sp. NK8]|uniref:hypothetical protein n=1 Tax=Caballeronia sp. NK8 TaxID=140098 RepID=UPI001BB4AB27|nr:hypothetical protein [Caballeronia sp. NK8]BCQ25398.1 hypothetical protein NK8_35750 [Caballeronia sp. NK8]